MGKKRHSTEQIISKLREAEVDLAKGQNVAQACKKLSVTEQTYYRWRKELEKENAGLKKLVAEAELDKSILREAARPHL